MHAVVNRLRLSSPIRPDTWARAETEISAKAGAIPGFEHFYAVQVADDEVVLVIVADSAEVLDEVASTVGNDFMRENVLPHLAEPPRRQVGRVVAMS